MAENTTTPLMRGPKSQNADGASLQSNDRRIKQHVEEPKPQSIEDNPVQPFSISDKLGITAICTLSIGLALLLASTGFLWFIWRGNDRNSTWRAIMIRGWATKTVALTSLIIRQAVSLQAAVATAIIACVALEQAIVPLLNLASVSITRNANGGPYILSWWLWKGFFYNKKRLRSLHWLLLITALVLSSGLIQLTSFALLSDLELVVIRTSSVSKVVPTNFVYNSRGNIPVMTHGSTWSQPVQSFVSFAEYHEPAQQPRQDGIVQTGTTLRAFLPIADQQERSMISGWDGRATVLDATAMCMRPRLVNPRVHYADGILALNTSYTFDFTGTSDYWDYGLESYAFTGSTCGDGGPAGTGICYDEVICTIPLEFDSIFAADPLKEPQQWKLAICQPKSILLRFQSQFEVRERMGVASSGSWPGDRTGNAYVLVNVSSGLVHDWARAIPSEDPGRGVLLGDGTPPLGFGVHGQNNEWYDLIFSENANLNLSMAVCYTAFDIADLHVQIEAFRNHSDTQPAWNPEERIFRYSDVRTQFGQDLDGDATYPPDYVGRNIMKLQPRSSWVPEPDYGDYAPTYRSTAVNWITDYSNMTGASTINSANVEPLFQARYLWQAFAYNNLWIDEIALNSADPTMIGLVQEIFQSGGSPAFAMQSIVTSLTELAYYQQISQLNGDSSVTSSTYVLAPAPVRFRGLLAVTIVLLVHIIVVFGIALPVFFVATKISELGNAWQTVAQVIDPKTEPILRNAVLATDSKAVEVVKTPVLKKEKKGQTKMQNHEIVGLRLSDGNRVHIVGGSDSLVGHDEENAVGSRSGRQASHQEDEHRENDSLIQHNYRPSDDGTLSPPLRSDETVYPSMRTPR